MNISGDIDLMLPRARDLPGALSPSGCSLGYIQRIYTRGTRRRVLVNWPIGSIQMMDIGRVHIGQIGFSAANGTGSRVGHSCNRSRRPRSPLSDIIVSQALEDPVTQVKQCASNFCNGKRSGPTPITSNQHRRANNTWEEGIGVSKTKRIRNAGVSTCPR
jgi:hypothetical protein